MKKKRIFLSSPHMGGNEMKYIKSAFINNWIAPLGPNVDNFENQISKYLGNNIHVSALSSGTASIHLALKILGIKENDIVLVQSLTFCGSSNPVKYLNAKIVFIDSELDTWNMCPDSLNDAILKYKNKSIKAIIPVHLYGMPAKMDEIVSISKKYNIPIIEDSAESLGSKFKGKFCGTFGDISTLSFNGNKIITTSGGGAFVSKNKNYVKKSIFLATQARDKAPHYEHSEIGFNYRMSNILAGIGLGQMEVLNERVKRRRRINKFYRNFFKNIENIVFQSEPTNDFFSNFWLTAIIIKPNINNINNKKIISHLEKDNIESRPIWKPMHLQPLYKNSDFIGKGNCDYIFDNGICLPSGSNLSDEDLDRITFSLKKVFSI